MDPRKKGKKEINFQDAILFNLRDKGKEVNIVLISGDKLVGKIEMYDKFTISIMDSKGMKHLVYKHAIAVISYKTS
jgi:RNA chaperone Hfq